MNAARQNAASKAVRVKGDLFGQDQAVYRAVLGAVMSHRLPPGTKLVEAALSESLRLPRAVVRMGLLRLAHDRIVELRPNRGAAVASPSIEEARQVYEARRLLEGALVARLCGTISRTGLAELRRMVQDGANAFEKGAVAQWITLAGRFHVRLAEFSGNEVIVRQVSELVSRSNLITALYMAEGKTLYSIQARQSLIEHLAKDTQAARRSATATMERLLHEVEERLEVLPPDGAGVDLRAILEQPNKGVGN